MPEITIGNRSMAQGFVSDERIIKIYFGHTLMYLYVGYTLLDSDEKYLLDSDGNNLMCL